MIRTWQWIILGLCMVLCDVNAYAVPSLYTATPVFPDATPLRLETKITSQSTHGYCAKVTIHNPQDKPHQGWQVEFNLGGNALKHLHPAKFVVTGDRVTVSPDSNKEYLEPHHRHQFELCTEGSGDPSVFQKSVTLVPHKPVAVLATSSKVKSGAEDDADRRNGKDKKEKPGYCVTVAIRNMGPDNVYDWRLSFDLGSDGIASVQHGKADKNTGVITITPDNGHHKDIRKDHIRTIKFCVRSACPEENHVDKQKPTVTILSPTANSTLETQSVLVSGIYSGPDNTGIIVNGMVAVVDGQRFYANDVPLLPGKNELEVVATSPSGKTAKHKIKVASSGISVLKLDVSQRKGGLSPLQVTFKYHFARTSNIQSITMDFDGDGVTDFSTANPNDLIRFTYISPGIYLAKMTITDTQGVTYSDVYVIQALDVASMDARFKAVFSRLNEALVCGNVESALHDMALYSRERYKPVLKALRPHFPELVASYSPLQQITVTTEYGEYAINRIIDGIDRIFFIYFIQDEDGVWRIDSM